MNGRAWVAGWTACLAACASNAPASRWAETDRLVAPKPEDHAGHDAVVLFDHHEIENVSLRSKLFTRKHVHRAVAVLTEDGFDHADAKIYYRKKGKIRDFRARTIRPDGTVVPIEPDNIFDDEAEDTDGYRVRTVQVPKVTVGSTVEYRYTIEADILRPYASFWVVRDIPVLDYRVTIRGPDTIKYAAQTFNSPENWSLDDRGKQWKLTLALQNVEPQPDASFSGSWRRTMPWWLFVVRQLVVGANVYDWATDWSEAVDWRCKALTWGDKDYAAGFDPNAVDVSGCEDPACKVDRALVWLRETVVFEAFWSWPGKSAREAVESGNGTGVDKARLLHLILEHHGIQSYFALTARRHQGLFDPNFPSPTGFDSLLLWLPAQDGIDEPLWVDPSCEYCRLGQVGRYHHGQPAVVMQDKEVALSTEGEVEARVEKITGDKPKLSAVGIVDHVEIRGRDLRIRTETIRTKRYAMFRRDGVSEWDAEDFEEAATNYVNFRSKVGVLRAHEPYAMVSLEPETYAGVDSETFDIPGHVVADGEALLVSLDFIKSGWDDDFENENDNLDVTFAYSRRFSHVVDIHAPEGYRFDQLPEDVRAGKSPLVVTIDCERIPSGIRIVRKVKTRHGIYPHTFRDRFEETTQALRDQRALSLRLVPVAAASATAASATAASATAASATAASATAAR
jgi:hypothetical protein